jgi:hypothetical protein
VDKAKVETVEQLPPPTDVKSLRSFLGHAGFYRRFIKEFSKITKPLEVPSVIPDLEKCIVECSHHSTSVLEPTFRDHV